MDVARRLRRIDETLPEIEDRPYSDENIERLMGKIVLPDLRNALRAWEGIGRVTDDSLMAIAMLYKMKPG